MFGLAKITSALSSLLSLFEALGGLWKFGKKISRGFSNEGVYEIIDYETTLTLHDPKGKKATLRKREEVKFLQDGVVVFEDFGWGEGSVMLNYKCSPGKVVDSYRSGYKKVIVISLRKIMSKGDKEEFNISWDMKDSFVTNDEAWLTEINRKFQNIKVNVIFPASRPPRKVMIEESNSKRSKILGEDSIKKLSNGTWRVSWETKNPRLYESYNLRWEW